jgi:hypothetical protein
MDYSELNEAIAGALNQALAWIRDEQLLLIEQTVHQERQRRLAANLGSTPQPGQRVRINFAPLINGVRESTRQELRLASQAVLAEALEQTRDYDEIDEDLVIEQLRIALSFNFIYEAHCEMTRRLDSVK